MIGSDWMLITAGSPKSTTMTQGAAQVFCGTECDLFLVRPQRYTREFMDAGDVYTLSFTARRIAMPDPVRHEKRPGRG